MVSDRIREKEDNADDEFIQKIKKTKEKMREDGLLDDSS
jgi:hypothetical protein